MPIGQDIGDAYIDVHARTGPFRRELRQDARRAANDASNQMEKNFDPDFGVVGNRLRKQMKRFGTLSGEEFTKAVQGILDSQGKSIANSFAKALATGDFTAFIGQFDDMEAATRQFNRSVERLKRSGALVKGEYQAINRQFRDFKRTLDESAAAAAVLEQDQKKLAASNARLLDIQKDMAAQQRASVQAQRDSERAIRERSAAQRAAIDLEVEFGEALDGVIVELQRTDRRFERMTRSVARNADRIKAALTQALRIEDTDTSALRAIDEALVRMRSTAKDTTRAVYDLDRGLGRLKGSRNNFLNLLGSIDQFVRKGTLRTLEGVLSGVGEGFGRLGNAVARLPGPFKRLGGVFSNVGDRIQGMGTSVDGFLVQLLLGAAATTAFVAILGPLTSLISALSASFVALTVSIGGAIAGGLIALGPMLYAVAAGAGALALAFTDMSDKQKAAFEPFSAWANEARAIVQEELFKNIGDSVQGLTDVLSNNLNPILKDVATQIRVAFSQFSEVIQGEAFQESLGVLQEFLPSILGNLLSIVGNLGIGLTNMFAAASPAAQLLLEKINGVVERFAAWTGQEDGRQAISTFMTDAVALLGSIWGLITTVSETFGIFWEEGNSSGKRMIDKLKDIVEQFNNWLNTEDGREQLRQWFEDAETIVGKVGDVLREAGELIDELDSPTNRAALLFILTGFQEIINIATEVVSWVNDIASAMTGIKDKGGISLQAVSVGLDRLSQKFRNIPSVVKRVAGRIKDAFSIDLTGIGNAIVNGLRIGITNGAAGLIALASWLASRVAGAFASVLGIFSPSRVFRDFGTDITDGLVLGMKSGQDEVQRVAEGLINRDALSNVNTPLGRLGQNDSPVASGRANAAPWSGDITIVTPYADPRLVALETVDALAAQGR